MDEFEKKRIENELKNSFEKRMREYQRQAEEYMDSLDFKRLESIKSKDIVGITEDDLIFIGFERIKEDNFDILYNYRDFDNIKIYFHRLPDRFEQLGYRLLKERDIYTVQELLDNSLLRWKLKIDIAKNTSLQNGPLGRLEPQTVMVDFIRDISTNKERIDGDLYLGFDENDGDNSDYGHHIINLSK